MKVGVRKTEYRTKTAKIKSCSMWRKGKKGHYLAKWHVNNASWWDFLTYGWVGGVGLSGFVPFKWRRDGHRPLENSHQPHQFNLFSKKMTKLSQNRRASDSLVYPKKFTNVQYHATSNEAIVYHQSHKNLFVYH